MNNINKIKIYNIIYFAAFIFIIVLMNIKTFAVGFDYNKSELLISYANETINLINNYRISNGIMPLKKNDTLMMVADIRAKEISSNFSPDRPDGTTTEDLLKVCGYFNSIQNPGVNMASGVPDPVTLVTAWQERIDSRDLMLKPTIEDIGVSVVRENGVYYWFAIFHTQNLNDSNRAILQGVLSNIITENMTEIEKIKAVHDYICLYLDYDTTYQYRSVTDSLIYKTAVCQGYANLFKAFMDILGIQNDFVTGHANGEMVDINFTEYINHSWNTVTLNGITYHIDTTWDDLTKEYGIICYDCFMVDEYTIHRIHENAVLNISYNMGSIIAHYDAR